MGGEQGQALPPPLQAPQQIRAPLSAARRASRALSAERHAQRGSMCDGSDEDEPEAAPPVNPNSYEHDPDVGGAQVRRFPLRLPARAAPSARER